MSYRSERYRIGLAGPDDAAQLLRLYECDDFHGRISVRHTRRPDPFRSLTGEGDRALIPIVTDTDNDVIVGMGACVIRRAFVNGEVRTTGYLTSLKGLPEYRMRVPLIPRVYRYLHEHTKHEVDLYYTTILKENVTAQKMLEKKRKNMPEYRGVGEYTVYCFRAGTRRRAGARPRTGAQWRTGAWRLERGSLAELTRLNADLAGSVNLAPADVHLPGLTDEDVYVLKNRTGAVEAACAVWNQQDSKQYVITEYGGIYRYLRRLPYGLLGYPDLPRANTVANYASIALLAVRNNDPGLAERFVRAVAHASDRYGFLMLGLFENHPLQSALRRVTAVRYRSRLYTVHWEDSILELDDRPLGLEVGLL